MDIGGKKERLFVGGPYHGQVLSVYDDESIQLPDPSGGDTFKKPPPMVEYFSFRVVVYGTEVTVYARGDYEDVDTALMDAVIRSHPALGGEPETSPIGEH